MARKHKPPITVRITERALVQRLRRALAQKGYRLFVNRGGNGPEGARYYMVDQRNVVSDFVWDLEGLGRELDVLHPWEQLAEGGI